MVPDGVIAELMTAQVDPSNVESPPGMGIFNAIAAGYWAWPSRCCAGPDHPRPSTAGLAPPGSTGAGLPSLRLVAAGCPPPPDVNGVRRILA